MVHMVEETDGCILGPTDAGSGLSRRRALGLTVAGAAAAWVAPQIISVSAAAAATAVQATMVAVGLAGTVITTTVAAPQNAGDWVDHGSITTSALRGVASNEQAGALRWVAVGDGGEIHTALGTALEWVAKASGTPLDLTGVAWTGSGFVAVGDQGIVLASADGVAWSTVHPADDGASLRGVTAAGIDVIAVGDAGRILRAPLADLTAWTTEASPTTPGDLDLAAVAPSGASFVAVGTEADLTSEFTIIVREAETWTTRTTDAPADAVRLNAVAIDPVTNLAVAAGIETHVRNDAPTAYSPAWQVIPDPVGTTIFAMTARDTSPTFVAVGSGGRIRADDSGLAFAAVASPTTNDLLAVAHD